MDKISDLPDEVLRHILSFLPSHDSIRTSLLSTRFRYLWKSIPVLDFRESHYSSTFKKMVDYALKNHENLSIIRRIRLSCYQAFGYKSEASEWIDLSLKASRFNLEELHIYIPSCSRFELSRTIFLCRNLKTIRICGGIVIEKIPINVRVFFPCLETLRLKLVSIVDGRDTLSKLLAGCPRLQNFDIDNCDLGSTRFIIPTADLKILSISNMVNRLDIRKPNNVWKNLTHLVVKDDKYLYDSQVLCFILEHSPNLTCLVLEKVFPYTGHNAMVAFPSVPCYKLETVKMDGFGGGFKDMEIVKFFLKNGLVLKKIILCYEKINEKMKTVIEDEPRASTRCQIQFYPKN